MVPLVHQARGWVVPVSIQYVCTLSWRDGEEIEGKRDEVLANPRAHVTDVGVLNN